MIASVVLVAGLAYGLWWFLHGNHFEATDNAYVQGNLVQVTPQVGGTVVAIYADETDRVRAGQPLVRLDDADAALALARAEAQLAQTVREVRTLYSSNNTLSAQVSARQAELARAQAEVNRARDDVRRREPLVASGAVAREDMAHARAQLQSAESGVAAALSALNAAREQLGTNQSLTAGAPLARHPNVLRAAAQVREAWLARQRSLLPAPVDGTVARRSVQVGQRVQAGNPLMALVALDQLWVDANFKEAQLRRLRIGQPAKLVADVYGKEVVFSGRITGMGAGTGAAFALLPAQNATGNWIKVTQRVPVRIALDARELLAHPLRVGLSMSVEVDVADDGRPPPAAADAAAGDAPQLADGAVREQPVAETGVFDAALAEADARVQTLIEQHGGGAAAGRPPVLRPPVGPKAEPRPQT